MNGIDYKRMSKGPAARTFLDGSQYWVNRLRTVQIGLGHFKPGWVWSKHAGAQTGKKSEHHIGIIQSGRMVISAADGSKAELGPGDTFEVGPGHDAWVTGEDLCIALDVSFIPGE